MAADVSEVLAIELCLSSAGAGKQAESIYRLNAQVTRQNQTARHGQQANVTSFAANRFRFAFERDPAASFYDRREFDLVTRREPDCPGAAGTKFTCQDRFGVCDRENVGERVSAHSRTFAQESRTHKHSQSDRAPLAWKYGGIAMRGAELNSGDKDG